MSNSQFIATYAGLYILYWLITTSTSQRRRLHLFNQFWVGYFNTYMHVLDDMGIRLSRSLSMLFSCFVLECLRLYNCPSRCLLPSKYSTIPLTKHSQSISLRLVVHGLWPFLLKRTKVPWILPFAIALLLSFLSFMWSSPTNVWDLRVHMYMHILLCYFTLCLLRSGFSNIVFLA